MFHSKDTDGIFQGSGAIESLEPKLTFSLAGAVWTGRCPANHPIEVVLSWLEVLLLAKDRAVRATCKCDRTIEITTTEQVVAMRAFEDALRSDTATNLLCSEIAFLTKQAARYEVAMMKVNTAHIQLKADRSLQALDLLRDIQELDK